jgi:hypothetical protein
MGFANATTPMGPNQLPTAEIETPERFRKANEAKLRDIADTTGGVILGRAGMAVLGDRADVLCVRLDGPVEARIAHAIAQGWTRPLPARTSARWTGRAMRMHGSSSTSARTIRACTTSSWTAPHCRWRRVSMSSSAPRGSLRRGPLITDQPRPPTRRSDLPQVQGRLHGAAQVLRIRGTDVILIVVDTDMPDDGNTELGADPLLRGDVFGCRSRWPPALQPTRRHPSRPSRRGSYRHGRPSRGRPGRWGHPESG